MSDTDKPAPEPAKAKCDYCGKVVDADPKECAMLSAEPDPRTGHRSYYCGCNGWDWIG